MKPFYFLTILGLIFSCSTKTEKIKSVDVIKNYDYLIKIDLWSFSNPEMKYILNNLRVDTYDSSDFNTAKKMTLYYISNTRNDNGNNLRKGGIVSVDTSEISFSKEQCDTLFILTNNFFKNINFKNYDTLGNLIPIIRDDVHARIDLNDGLQTLSANLNSINDPRISSLQLDTLLNFIQKFKFRNNLSLLLVL